LPQLSLAKASAAKPLPDARRKITRRPNASRTRSHCRQQPTTTPGEENTMTQTIIKADQRRSEFQSQLAAHLGDPQLLDLSRDVALLRLMAERATSTLESGERLTSENSGFLLQIVSETSRVIQRKAAVDASHSVSPLQIRDLQIELVHALSLIPVEQARIVLEYLKSSTLLRPAAAAPPALSAGDEDASDERLS
jgi:hypothetical protein